MTNNNQDDKDEGDTLKRKGIKRKNLLEMLESKAEKNFKLKTEEMEMELERRKLEFEERNFEMQMEKDKKMLDLLGVLCKPLGGSEQA